MEIPTEDVEPMIVTRNGDGPPGEVLLNPKLPARYTNLGRFYEILAILSAVAILVVYGLNFGGWVSGAALIVFGTLSVWAYRLAIGYAVKATRVQGLLEKARAADESARTSLWKYKITNGRIKTLEAADVPKDVTETLHKFVEESPLPKKQFLEHIARNSDLSLERINEFADTVLKYTKVDSHPDVVPKPNQRAEIGK